MFRLEVLDMVSKYFVELQIVKFTWFKSQEISGKRCFEIGNCESQMKSTLHDLMPAWVRRLIAFLPFYSLLYAIEDARNTMLLLLCYLCAICAMVDLTEFSFFLWKYLSGPCCSISLTAYLCMFMVFIGFFLKALNH